MLVNVNPDTIMGLLKSNLPLSTAGIDPSTPFGAQVLALRLRLRWLAKGWHIPAHVERVTVPRGSIHRKQLVYHAGLDMRLAVKVDREEALMVEAQITHEAREVAL